MSFDAFSFFLQPGAARTASSSGSTRSSFMSTGSPYVPLWCKSNFSFLEGASHAEELVEEAHQHGLRAIALTDRDGVHGVVRAHTKAKELGMKLVCGAQVTVAAPGAALAP